MQLPTVERIGASKVLQKIRQSLEHSEVKFHSSLVIPTIDPNSVYMPEVENDEYELVDDSLMSHTVQPNCPIYFYSRLQKVYVLHPAVVSDSKSCTVPTLDQVLTDITNSAPFFATHTILGKDLVIPIANNYGFNQHFVTLYYNSEEHTLTVYDSKPAGFVDSHNLKAAAINSVITVCSSFRDPYASILTILKSHGIATDVSSLEVKHLGLQTDHNSCGYWTRVLAIKIAEEGNDSITQSHRKGDLTAAVLEDLREAVAVETSSDKTTALLTETASHSTATKQNKDFSSRSSLSSFCGYIKSAIKIILLIALLFSICFAALFIACNPAVGIGLFVGAGVAVAGYGAYKFFKCCAKDKNEEQFSTDLENIVAVNKAG